MGTPAVVPSLGVTVQEITSPFWCSDAASVAVVGLIRTLFLVQVYPKVMLSPSASVAVPGLQFRLSVVVAVAGPSVTLDRTGAALEMVCTAVPLSPVAMPSVGVTSTDQVSPFRVAEFGSVDVTLADDNVPFLYQS